MTDVAGRWAREEAGDSIARVIPEALWKIRTRRGEPLDGIHVLAWRWLADRADRHGRVEFRAVDLAGRFGRRSHTSALQWIAALESAGLAADVASERGACGYTRLRLADAAEVAARGELAARAADPQLELELDLEGDEPALAEVSVPFASQVEEIETKCRDAEPHRDISTHVAAECPDVPPALWEALGLQLGRRNAELYLGLSVFSLSAGDGAPHRIVFPNAYLRDYVARNYRAAIEQAFARVSLAGAVAMEVATDRPPPKCRDAEQHRDITAQQPTVGLVLNPSRVQNQPTNQREDFFKGGAGSSTPDGVQAGTPAQQTLLTPAQQTLLQAAELYQRIGDASLWKWVAIATVLLVEERRVSQAEVDALVRDHGDDFGHALKALAEERRCWPKMGRLKSQLRARGIKWKRSWERGLHPNASAGPPAQQKER